MNLQQTRSCHVLSAFRLNLEFGLVLVNTDTGEYRYFVPYSNEALFQRPIYISRRQDLRRLRLRLNSLNITLHTATETGLKMETRVCCLCEIHRKLFRLLIRHC